MSSMPSLQYVRILSIKRPSLHTALSSSTNQSLILQLHTKCFVDNATCVVTIAFKYSPVKEGSKCNITVQTEEHVYVCILLVGFAPYTLYMDKLHLKVSVEVFISFTVIRS